MDKLHVKIDTHTTDLQAVSSYVESDKELNVLISTKVSSDEKSDGPEPRWAVIANPVAREEIDSVLVYASSPPVRRRPDGVV